MEKKKNTKKTLTNNKNKNYSNKKTTSKKYPKPKTTNKKNNNKVNKPKPKTKQTDLSNTEILNNIIEKNKSKKVTNNKKTTNKKNNKQPVKNNKPKKENLLITKEIDTRELKKYLMQEQEELENTLHLNELAEQVAEKLKEEENIQEEKKSIKKDKKTEEELQITDIVIDRSFLENDSKFKITELHLLIILILVLGGVFTYAFLNIKPSRAVNENKINTPQEEKEVTEDTLLEMNEKYNECLNEKYNENDTSEEIETYISDVNNNISSLYNMSLIYKDLTNEFTYSYNTEQTYYAASTIKILDGLYLYTKASLNEINLNEEIVYTEANKLESSKYMDTHKVGDKISLRDLVKASVEVSDNSAHQMLINYIGKNKYIEFAKSLGATNVLNTGDLFGEITPQDALHYTEALYNYIKNNGELGEELKSYLINAEQNDIAVPEYNVQAAHKYGEYNEYYHDIGIVYDVHPYLIVILTREGNKDFENIIKDINKKIYELHRLFYENREKMCKDKMNN